MEHKPNAYTEYDPSVDNDIDDRYNKAVADILRDKKEHMGITFDDLASASDLPRATVSRILYGQRDIKVYALRRLASVLELNVGEVMDEASAKIAAK